MVELKKDSKEIIQVAITTDKNYIQHLGVMLCSLFEHNKNILFKVNIIVDSEKHIELKKIKKIVEDHKSTFQLIKVDETRLASLKISEHATAAVYYRLLLPDLLDNKVTKVLYFDSDIIVKSNLLPLWETELTNYPVAAVRELLFQRHKELGIPEGVPYFNSGVMLINLPVWRERKVSERALDFINENPERIRYWDQDGINAVLKGNWLEMPYKWNQQSEFFSESVGKGEINEEWLKESFGSPAIIHFSSKFKPWHYWCNHPHKKEYFFYLRQSPWKNFKMKEHTAWHEWKQRVKRAVNQVVGREIFKIYA